MYTYSHLLSYFFGGKSIVTTIPVEIVLPDTRKLIVEQIGDYYSCSLYQLSSEKKTYLQIAGADGNLRLKIEGVIDATSSYQRILQWIGEKNAVALFNSMHLFGDRK